MQDYIIANVNATLASAPIDYVKWDMHRHIPDHYRPALAEPGRFSHRYILGLYRVLQSIVEQNPDVLFEGCSSGGNRFDPVSYTHLDVYKRQLVLEGLRDLVAAGGGAAGAAADHYMASKHCFASLPYVADGVLGDGMPAHKMLGHLSRIHI